MAQARKGPSAPSGGNQKTIVLLAVAALLVLGWFLFRGDSTQSLQDSMNMTPERSLQDWYGMARTRWGLSGPSDKDAQGRTMAHYAAIDCIIDVLNDLKGRGADLMAVDHEGRTPFDLVPAAPRYGPGGVPLPDGNEPVREWLAANGGR